MPVCFPTTFCRLQKYLVGFSPSKSNVQQPAIIFVQFTLEVNEFYELIKQFQVRICFEVYKPVSRGDLIY